MQHYAAFHIGLHCVQKYSFRDFSIQRVNVLSLFGFEKTSFAPQINAIILSLKHTSNSYESNHR